MDKISTKKINELILLDSEEFVKNEDIRLDNFINSAAEKIALEKDSKPIILLSGPSGSGKTTSAYKIEKHLDCKNIHTTVISMDNYFKPYENTLSPEELEKPDRLDAELLISDIEKFINGDPVYTPIYDFKTATRRFNKKELVRKPNEMILIEGIHVLNPSVMNSVFESANGVYVSPRTRIELENGTLIHPQKLRLLRRLLRDTKYRGQSVESTIEKSVHVDWGEDLYIMPYKDNAKIQINTFSKYEVPILKNYLYDKIINLDKSILDEYNLHEIVALFNETESVNNDSLVSPYAVLREFIGSSKFKYK